jgi:hypothetical protein
LSRETIFRVVNEALNGVSTIVEEMTSIRIAVSEPD